MENEENAGVDQGQEQNNQPANDDNIGDQGNEDILKSFYQLPDDVRAAINSLPEEQRTQTIKAFDDHRASQETGFNDRLERGRKAEDSLNALLQIPEVVSFLQTGSMPNQQQPNQQQESQRRDFSKYGEGAEDFAKDLVAEIADAIGVQGIKDEVAGIRNVFTQNQQQTDLDALKAFTKENDLPDPDNYVSTMASIKRNNPGLTIDQAYRAALDSNDLLQLRQPVNQPRQQAEEQTRQPVNNEPGGNRGSGSPRSVTEQDADPVEAALKARREGKPFSIGGILKTAIPKVLAKWNEDHGTNLTEDDLS